MSKQRQKDDNPWRAIGLVTAVGGNLAVCVGGGFWLGQYVGERLGGVFWVMVGVLIGLAVGMIGTISMIRKFTGD